MMFLKFYLFYPVLFLVFCLDNVHTYNVFSRDRVLTVKQKAYILSIKASAVMFLFSIYMNYKFAQASFDIYAYEASSSEFHRVLESVNLLYFSSYLVCDMWIGTVFYPRYLMSLTGYFHHIIYILFNILTVVTKTQSLFLVFMVSELPTFILSIGSYNANARSDTLFGLTFLVTRILYHMFLCMHAYKYHTLFFILSSSVFGLHLFWFKNWVRHYMLPLLKW